ncbi:UNVERIFIED_CONTAM: hypothetical protein FKN15_049005 [Acipenser sinensis]
MQAPGLAQVPSLFYSKRERERDRQREGERDREREREKERAGRDGEREGETERQREREREGRERHGEMERWRERGREGGREKQRESERESLLCWFLRKLVVMRQHQRFQFLVSDQRDADQLSPSHPDRWAERSRHTFNPSHALLRSLT